MPQFDYLNYGSWALDGIGRLTFTPAIPQQLTGYKAELYSYNEDGYLVEVREAQSSYDYLTGQIIPPNNAAALTRSLTSYDPMGRVTGMVEYAASGTTIAVQYYHYYNGIMLASNGNNGNDRPDMQTALSAVSRSLP